MIRHGAIATLVVALIAFGGAVAATPPVALDPLDGAMNPGAMDPLAEPVRPAVPTAIDRVPSDRVPSERAPAGNPLWAVPLRLLSVTRERPLFSPSRRPPAPAVVAAPYMPPPAPIVKAAEPDHPLLSIVGTIVGETAGIGVFIDEATHDVIRLKTGQDHDGWVLRSIQGRDAVFEKDRRKATLTLPVPGGEQTAQAPSAAPGAPAAARVGNTWTDGDGQLITPPRRTSQPIGVSPAAATPAGGTL
jgi:general secretion pathway protein N